MDINCLPQWFTKLTLSMLLFAMGLGAVIVGLTVLPFVGLIFAVPFFALAIYFFRAYLNRQCEIPED